MWTFILVLVIILGIKIFCRVIGGLIFIGMALTDSLDELSESSASSILKGVIKLIITIPLFIWGLILLF